MLFSPQIPLPLEPSREQRFEDYIPGPNGAVVKALKSILQDRDAMLYLSGADGTGKSHLLNALCLAAREQGMTAFQVSLRTMPADSHAMLEGLEQVDLICIDDLDKVAGTEAWELALFHCLNRVRARKGRLVISSSERLSALEIGLPDLVSRLQWGLRLQLLGLEDADKIRVLEQQASSLGIDLPADVYRYLLRHHSRNLGRLQQTVERLKQAAFTGKRRITVPLVKEVLQRPPDD